MDKPLDGIFGIMRGLPQGHNKPLKHALYNAVALFLLFICCAAGWALYVILQPFIKPLMWAVLVGSVLHPLKQKLRTKFEEWFDFLEDTHTPVVLGVVLLPVNIVNNLSEFIGNNLLKHVRLIITVCITVPILHITYFYTPSFISYLIWKTCMVIYGILNLGSKLASPYFIALVLLGYLSLVYFNWTPNNNNKFQYATFGIWFISSLAFSNWFGLFQIPVFILLQMLFIGGLIFELINHYRELTSQGQQVGLKDLIAFSLNGKTNEENLNEDIVINNRDVNSDLEPTQELEKIIDVAKPKSKVSFDESANKSHGSGDSATEATTDEGFLELFKENTPIIGHLTGNNSEIIITNQGIHVIQPPENSTQNFQRPMKKLQRSVSQPHISLKKLMPRSSFFSFKGNFTPENENEHNSESVNYGSKFYLYSVVWACVAMLFWKNVVLIPLLPLPILLYVFKHSGFYFGLWQWMYGHLKTYVCIITEWCKIRHDAFLPLPLRGVIKITFQINIVLKRWIKESIDTVSSCVVIFGLIVFLICASVFIAIQIYAEAIMLIQITGNVINQTVVHNPELRQILPDAWDETVDSILNNAYQYGREGISKAVRGVMTNVDSAKSDKLEKQVLELWDRVYQSWMTSDHTNGPKVTPDAVFTSWEAFISDIKKSPEMFNINGLVDFTKQNIGTLMSLLESVWSLVRGNISLVLSSVGTFLSVILGGGTAVLNFILNVVVFLTTLFYLLNSSGELYKPVEIMTQFSSSGTRFGHALEGAINGVFTASFKMAAFYGLWTWFIHNLFGVRIVYLPSAFATILGAIPFLGTYWACIPGVLDLWLAQDRGLGAIIFAGFQFLPTSVVDTTLYKEIKGGHPYLTGLAIAGGIFCLGVEGAIIGPILLCGLYVAMDLSSTIFKESPSEESLNRRLQQFPK